MADEVPAIRASMHIARLWAGWVGGRQALCSVALVLKRGAQLAKERDQLRAVSLPLSLYLA